MLTEVRDSRVAQAHSWVAGFMLALPFSYPSVPYYWGAGIVFVSMLIYARRNIDLTTALLVIGAMITALISNLLGLSGYPIGTPQILFTTIFFMFFLFGRLVPSADYFFRGYFFGILLLAIAVIIAFIAVAPWSEGLLMFSIPEYRLWGAQYFPDWPNFLAFMLALGFLIGQLFQKRKLFAFICIVAAILTTSRTPLIGIIIWFFVAVAFIRFGLSLTLVATGIVAGSLFLMLELYQSTELVARLLVFSDREEVYASAWRLFLESPLIGHGGVLLDESVGNAGAASFHNSYLDILVRHGILGFLIFLPLIVPSVSSYKGKMKGALLTVTLFFLVSSFFQNFLKHPHLIMFYSVLLSCFFRKDDHVK